MKTKIFIIINSNSIIIKGDDIDKTIRIRNEKLTENEMDKIYSALNETKGIINYECIFVLNENFFWNIDKVITENIDNNNDEIHSKSGFFNLKVNEILNFELLFYTGPRILKKSNRNGKSMDFKKCYYWKPEMVHPLINYFKTNDVEISSLIPSFYLNKDFCYPEFLIRDQIIFSLQKERIYITLFDKEKNIRFFNSLNYGTDTLVGELSDVFKICVDYSRKILKKCKYIYLPENLVDYSIDVPLANKEVKCIELTEISYVVRKWFQAIIDDMVLEISHIMPDISQADIIFNMDDRIYGYEQFLIQIFGNEVLINDAFKFNYYSMLEKLKNIGHITGINEVGAKTEKVELPDKIQEDENSKVSLKERLIKIIDTKLHNLSAIIAE